MIKSDKPKIYSQFEIIVLIFYSTVIFFMPIILVLTYLFEVDKSLNINTFMLWTLFTDLLIMVVGTVFIVINKDKMKRKVKATYRGEFFYLIFLFAFGLLGFIVIYDYMGGNRAYIANILVILFSALLYLLIYLGRRYFKFDYMRKK
ncbi:hypothetical protein RJI07_01230 [Mycoplasmatota bacterium WC30]